MKIFFIMLFFGLVIGFGWTYILENIGGLNLKQLNHDNKILYFLLVICPPLFTSIFLTELFDKEEENNTQKVEEPKVEEPKVEEPKVEEPKVDEPKVDEPKVDEIISVTEIKGVKKIIKNGKVIYCEQLKADELKVFEQLNEKNPTVTSGIKTYTKE